MNQLPVTLIYTIVIALGLSRCDHQLRYRQIPFAVQRHFAELPDWEKPKKVQVDIQRRRVYWLNQKGEIWAIRSNGRDGQMVNKGIGAQLGITYIQDFTLNPQSHTLYFTDLMDIASGLSAIKSSDFRGKNIETLATFSTETPYAITWDESTQHLYYLTKPRSEGNYQLRTLGQALPLASTQHELADIPVLLSGLSNPSAQSMADQSAPVF